MLLPFLIAFIFINPTFAQDTIIVTADRIKTSLEHSPSDISIYKQPDLQKVDSITELFSRDSDLTFAQSGPIGGNTSLFIRGTDSSHTLVIIDGIIMNDPSNPNRQFDLGKLSLNNIEQIEILKGSQGLLYGSNAIGGVILITTKTAKEKLSAATSLDYSSYSTVNAALDVQKKMKNTGVSFGIDQLSTTGFSAANDKASSHPDADGVKRTTLSTGLNHFISDFSELKFNYRYVNEEVELDKSGGIGGDDPNDSQSTEQQFFKLEYMHEGEKSENKFVYAKTLHHRTLNVRRDHLNTTEFSETTKGLLDSISINHSYFLNEDSTLNANLDFQQERDQLKNSNENYSLFLYSRFAFNKYVVNMGGRVDYNKYFGEYLTYKAALLRAFSHFTIKASLSTGFRTPSLNQLFDPTYGNKSLRPEESRSIDAGAEVRVSEHIRYEAAVFKTDLNNRHSYAPVTFVNINSGKAQIVGMENSLKSKLNDLFDTSFSTTWLSAKDLATSRRLARRPQVNSNLFLNMNHNQHRFSLETKYTGKRADVDNLGNTVEMRPYTVTHLQYYFELFTNFTTYLKVKNILNHQYEDVFGYGTGGRITTVGLKYVF